ncbi:TPA: helix-turn-helix transcriptional regulator, partial [Mannheimia haemolytica]|nr:helix-turn-helix transcriptional regulator [Mannheimia haemolytica]HDL5778146.1 helix-turn-helix transcriptional regulator [Mannheimia haemolytica]HDL6129098.1 helix-turn-helix transcriptional regulator [Mannheimia haemolytica]HDL6310613.1 helix-turn-helix transcriptional regulator [Mannheimia haemolytica]HDZ6828159.1 helix-turn-helix transcriptional regulator [Mannheimia haemolytica]
MKVHEKIKLLRENNHWTQDEMAQKLSMTTKGYAKIERGETISNLPKIEQIAEV